MRLIHGNKIGITPVERLTDFQKYWLSEHRRDILAELRSEGAEESANVDNDPGSRWNWFVSLATSEHVTAAEVAQQFSGDDMADLLSEPDSILPAHAATIVDAIKRDRRTTEPLCEVQIATSKTPELLKDIQRRTVRQTCGGCQHFERISHPNLGHCRIQAEAEAPCGHWDADSRDYCHRWEMRA